MIIITKWLCPRNHVTIAFAWDDATCTQEEVEKLGAALFATGEIDRRCDICHGEIAAAHIDTPYDTLPQAQSYLMGLHLNEKMKAKAVRELREALRN